MDCRKFLSKYMLRNIFSEEKLYFINLSIHFLYCYIYINLDKLPISRIKKITEFYFISKGENLHCSSKMYGLDNGDGRKKVITVILTQVFYRLIIPTGNDLHRDIFHSCFIIH